MKTFAELGLNQEFISMLEKAGITTPSEIQEKTIPLVLTGKDIIGSSATGSGKTLAFASAIVENLQKNKTVQALILTPTRELAEQVSDSINNFSRHKKINVISVYGGVNIENQIRNIRNADVVVGTPGRVLDHIRRNTLNLSNVKFLVLDEVDRMFDMGFQRDVETIISKCPKKRQTILFSATVSPEIDWLAKKHTQNPVEVFVTSHIDPSKLKQIYYNISDNAKFSLFVHLLKEEKSNLVMVFCGTRRNVDFVANNLINLGIKAKAIHGGMIQNKRNRVMSEFNSEKGINVLVCTDVAARGLDIPGVSHVYNYDLPKTSTEYIHRIGRTARAGREGIAINILCSRDYENFGNILQDRKLKIDEVKTPIFEPVRIIVEEKRRFQGRENSGFRNNSRRSNFMGKRSFGERSNSRREEGRGRVDSDRKKSLGRDGSGHSPRDSRERSGNRKKSFGNNKGFRGRR